MICQWKAEQVMTRRTQQAQQSRLHLINTALKLFAEQGWEHTSIPELAQAAGISQGLMYHYFRNKQELLLAVFEQHSFLPKLYQLLSVSTDRPTADVLREIAFGFAALLREKQHLVQICSHEAQANPEVEQYLNSMIEEGVTLLANYVEARIAIGELRAHDASVTARSLLYTIFMLHLRPAPSGEFIPSFIDLLLHGIAVSDRPGL